MIGNQLEPKEAQMTVKFHGIEAFEVAAINPQGSILENLNVNKRKIAPYVPEDGKYAKIEIWLRRPEEGVFVNPSFFINREPKESNSPGKFIWIDQFGNNAGTWMTEEEVQAKDFTYTSKNETITSFDKTTARKALGDEIELCQFIKTWLHLEPQVPVTLETDKFFNNDFSELHELFNRPSKSNRIVTALGIKDNGHYEVYKKVFGRAYRKSNNTSRNRIVKALDKDAYTTSKINFGETPYEWKEYKDTQVETTNTSGTGSTNDTGKPANKLPF